MLNALPAEEKIQSGYISPGKSQAQIQTINILMMKNTRVGVKTFIKACPGGFGV